MDGSEAVVFVFLHTQKFASELPRVHLQGLEHEVIYQVIGIENEPLYFKGKNLMHVGLKVRLTGDFDSKLIRLKRL